MLRLKYLFFCSAFAFALTACSDDESGSGSFVSTEGSGDNDIVFDASSSSHKGKEKSSSSSVYSSSSSEDEENENSDEWDAQDSSSSEEEDSHVADPIVVPVELDPTPVEEGSPIKINKMSVTPNQDQSVFAISGGASFDLSDSWIPSGAEMYITSMQVSLVKMRDDVMFGTPLEVTCNGNPCELTTPVQVVNLTEMKAQIEDKDMSDCGNFRIVVSYSASYDMNNPHMFISNDTIDFTRDEVYCEEPEEEIVVPEKPGSNVVLTSYEITVNTKRNEGLSLSTGTVVPLKEADVYFTSDDLTDEISIYSQNGAKIAPYSNYSDNNYQDDWNIKELPPEPTHMSDFRYSETLLGNFISDFDSFIFYVVKTPDFDEETGEGFFAFTTKKVSLPDDNKNIKVTLLVYKK